jgi:hypothetical protein
MLLITGGIIGSLVGGYILDKSKAYKYAEIIIIIQYLYIFSLNIEQ